jgi:hypothetical protein
MQRQLQHPPIVAGDLLADVPSEGLLAVAAFYNISRSRHNQAAKGDRTAA